jgi:hypothetical protein
MNTLTQFEFNELSEISIVDAKELNGGFFPIVVWGVVIGAEYVAALFIAGVGVGAAVAQGQHK